MGDHQHRPQISEDKGQAAQEGAGLQSQVSDVKTGSAITTTVNGVG